MYDIHSELTQLPQVDPSTIDRFLKDCPLTGLGSAFVESGNKHGINPIFVLSLAILESGWGKSYYAIHRNNLFGYMAYDSNPDMAGTFSSKPVCIDFISCFLANSYLKEKNGQLYTLPNGQQGFVGQWYGGEATPHGVFVNYSTSHDNEANSIVLLMNQFVAFAAAAVGEPQVVVASQPVVTAPVNDDSLATYTTVSGDTLGGIAVRFYHDYSYWSAIARANDIIDPRRLGIGVTLRLPGKPRVGVDTTAPVQNPTGRTYIVQAVDGAAGLWGISQKMYGNGARWGEIAQANNISSPYIIHVGDQLRIP